MSASQYSSATMPNIRAAKKDLRSAAKRRVFNLRRKAALKEATKTLDKLAAAKDRNGAQSHLPTLYKAIDKATKRGLLKKNTAGRKKARAARIVKAIA